MPIYEYQCKACKKTFEDIACSSSAPAPACPECHSAKTHKLMSCACFQVSGGSGGDYSGGGEGGGRSGGGCAGCPGGNCASCH